MENLTILKMPRSISELKLTPEHLCIASTLIAPLVLLIFLPLVSVFILTMLALFSLSVAIFHIRKDRDSCRNYLQICGDLLKKEKGNFKNNQGQPFSATQFTRQSV
jgi:hypothetical protein